MNENQNQSQQNEKLNQAYTEAAAKAEPKTVINGKTVSLQQAQAAEAAFNKTMNQTGIQAHHDNNTEAVNAGQVASQSMSTAEAGAAQAYNQQAVKATDVQSGQAELEKAMQNAGQQEQAGSQQTMQQQNQKAAQAAQTAQDQSAMQTEAQKTIQQRARAAQKKGE